MRFWRLITHILLTVLLALGASGIVSAKVASGAQHLLWTAHQADDVFSWLTHQGKSVRSTTGPPGSPVATKSVANPVPGTLARVVPGNINPKNLGTTADVFVTDAKALQGLNARQIADKLTIPQSSSGFKVIEFPTPSSGIASPVFRNNPGFVGGGRTAGGAPEFVIPNGPVPAGATTRIVR